MANLARIVGGVAVDLTPAAEMSERWHDSFAGEFVAIPDGVENGWRQDEHGGWSPPAAAPPASQAAPPPEAFLVDVPTFKMRFAPGELVAIRASTDPLVKTFLAEIVDDPRTERVNLALPFVAGAVGYLAGEVDLGAGLLTPRIIDPERVAEILAPL